MVSTNFSRHIFTKFKESIHDNEEGPKLCRVRVSYTFVRDTTGEHEHERKQNLSKIKNYKIKLTITLLLQQKRLIL